MLNLLNPSRFVGSGLPPGFPQTAAPVESAFPTAGISRAVNMPAVVNSGDLLLVSLTTFFQSLGVANSSAAPAGWTKIYEDNGEGGTTSMHHAIHAKVADGTEDGTTVTFDLVTSSRSATAQCYRVTNWFGSLAGVELTSVINVVDDSPDPPNLNVSWGVANSLWFALLGVIDDDGFGTVAPTGFSDMVSTVSGAGVDMGSSTVSARRELSAASLNPAVFTLSQLERWSAVTLAVRPAA